MRRRINLEPGAGIMCSWWIRDLLYLYIIMITQNSRISNVRCITIYIPERRGTKIERNFTTEMCTCIGMHGGKREHIFIEDHITGYVNTSRLGINTFDAFVKHAIPKKDALKGVKR